MAEVLGEVVRGAGTIRTTDHGDGFVVTAHVAEILDLAEEDVGQLLLGELQVATWEVVGHGDGASGHRDLQHAAGHPGDVLGLHRRVRGSEVDGAGLELAYSSAGSNRLVVHLNALRCQFLEPTGVDGRRERGASPRQLALDLVSTTAGRAGGEADASGESCNDSERSGLKRTTHDFDDENGLSGGRAPLGPYGHLFSDELRTGKD